MFQLYAVFAFSLSLIVFAAHSQPTNAKKQENDARPAFPIMQVAPQQHSREHIEGNQTEHIQGDVRVISSPPKDGYDKAAFWLNAVLATVGIGGIAVATFSLCFIKRQTVEMRRQRIVFHKTLTSIKKQVALMEGQSKILQESVTVAQKSAAAAEQSVDLMIVKERAKLTLEIIEFLYEPQPLVRYKITNHGSTTAFIKSSWEMCRFLPIRDVEWPSTAFGVPLYNLPESLGSGEYTNYSLALHPDEEASAVIRGQVNSGDWSLFFRVRIVYEDIFEREHPLIFSKIYGVAPESTDPMTAMLSNILIGLGSPEWRNSVYKYGEE